MHLCLWCSCELWLILSKCLLIDWVIYLKIKRQQKSEIDQNKGSEYLKVGKYNKEKELAESSPK